MPHSYVYIIYSVQLDKYYVGYSSDADKRLSDHNSGISTFTVKASDWVFKWKRKFVKMEEDVAERRIKNKRSRKYHEWFINNDQDNHIDRAFAMS